VYLFVMSTALADLLADVQAAATRALADLKARDIPYVVTYTLRSTAEQRALYAQGRDTLLAVNSLRDAAGLPHISAGDNGYTVTNCDGVSIALGGHGRSMHQLGRALDVVPLGPNGPVWPSGSDPRWEDIAHSFEAEGFEWGGRWTKAKDGIDPDRPHHQYPA
jgi:hypothetical protein